MSKGARAKNGRNQMTLEELEAEFVRRWYMLIGQLEQTRLGRLLVRVSRMRRRVEELGSWRRRR